DSNAVGIDQTDGSDVALGGNYGILYLIHLSTQSSDGRNLGLLFNPRGGAWGGAVRAPPGITPGGIFLVHASTGSLAGPTMGVLEAKYSPGCALDVWFYWMPTGGSSFPVRLVAAPF
ncbi:MAG TPA: hypothetical protein VFV14_10335, partial [Myxococcaceae bacterium]|nr:hypothetical protein [Myxococcaceae bacterium]